MVLLFKAKKSFYYTLILSSFFFFLSLGALISKDQNENEDDKIHVSSEEEVNPVFYKKKSESKFLPYELQVKELEKIFELEGKTKTILKEKIPKLIIKKGEKSSIDTCAVCGKPLTYHQKCGGCKYISYCSKEHQEQDWKYHQHACPSLKQLNKIKKIKESNHEFEIINKMWTTIIQFEQNFHQLHKENFLSKDWKTFLERYLTEEGDSWKLSDPYFQIFSQQLSGPLTILFGIQTMGLKLTVQSTLYTIVLMGASSVEQKFKEYLQLLLYFSPFSELETIKLKVLFVGPELETTNSIFLIDDKIELHFFPMYFHDFLKENVEHKIDLIIGLNCGFVLYPSWGSSLKALVESNLPALITTYRKWEQEGEVKLLKKVFNSNFILHPQPNPFASLEVKQSGTIFNDIFYDNSYIYAIQGEKKT